MAASIDFRDSGDPLDEMNDGARDGRILTAVEEEREAIREGARFLPIE